MKKIQNKQIRSVGRPAYTTWAFTLVELIVVITILAILGTIAFISLKGYSAQARDSKRLSDIQNIKKSLELFSLNTGKYPEPDEKITVSYSGELARYQGIVGDQVSTNLSRNLNEKPTDPLTGAEYIYATTHNQTEFEVLGLYETELVSILALPLKQELGWVNESNAASLDFPKIEGNYNGIYVKTPKFYVPTPSIINGNIWGNIDFFDDETLIESQVITGGDNIPGVSTGGLDIALSVYEGTITADSTEEEKVNLVNTIKTAYSGSTLANDTSYADILSRTSTGEMVDFVDVVVLEIAEYSTFASSWGGDGDDNCDDGYAWNGIACVSLAPFIRTLGGTYMEEISSISTDSNGNIYVGGYYVNSVSNSKNVVDFDGNTLLGESVSSIEYDGFVAKLDSSGNQVWIKSLGGEGADSVTGIFLDLNGDIYVGARYYNNLSDSENVVDFTGNTLLGVSTSVSYDGLLIKLDSNGNQIWIKKIGGTGYQNINKVFVDTSGNIYACGDYWNDISNTHNVVDLGGNTLRGKTSTISRDGYIAKLDNNGNQQWIKTIGGTTYDGTYIVVVDTSGNVYVGGYYWNDLSDTKNVVDFGGNSLNGKSSIRSVSDGYVAKLDSNGNQQWIKTFGGDEYDYIKSLALDNSGNLYIGGYFENDLSNNNRVVDFGGNTLNGKSSLETYDGYVAKLDSNGNQQWIKTIGGDGNDYTDNGISTDSSGNVYVSGWYNNDSYNTNGVVDFSGNSLIGYGNNDGYVAKLDSNGNQTWIKKMGGVSADDVYSLHVDSNLNIYLGGKYHNDLSNTNNVVDFSGEVINGLTDIINTDVYLIRISQ